MATARPRQAELDFRTDHRGGPRAGAGRKPTGERSRGRHERRPDVKRSEPRHITLRVCGEVGRLRRPAAYAAIRGAIAVCIGRPDFRIVHASIQGNHIHLIVEADNKKALTRGVRAFLISAARRLNRACRRRGPVFTARYHAVAISSPRQARQALCYVLNNWRRHREDLRGTAEVLARLDPYSSAVLFDGWREYPHGVPLPPTYDPLPCAGARTWLLTTGWRRHRALGIRERPATARGPDVGR